MDVTKEDSQDRWYQAQREFELITRAELLHEMNPSATQALMEMHEIGELLSEAAASARR